MKTQNTNTTELNSEIKQIENTNYYVTIGGEIISTQTSVIKTLKPILNKTTGYYQVCLKIDNKFTTKYIHQLVVEHFLGKKETDLEIDHIDRDKSNNNLSNLQITDKSTNRFNRSCQNKTGYKGVYLNKQNKQQVQISIGNYKKKYGGCYSDIKTAHQVYKDLFLKYNGFETVI